MNNEDGKRSFNQQDKRVLHDVQENEAIQKTVITPEKDSPKDLTDALILEKEDHDDMEKILSYVVENDLPDEFVVLLKAKLQKRLRDTSKKVGPKNNKSLFDTVHPFTTSL